MLISINLISLESNKILRVIVQQVRPIIHPLIYPDDTMQRVVDDFFFSSSVGEMLL